MSINVFVGLDWAVHTHAVCLIDAAGSVVERFEVTHDHDGLTDLMRHLAAHRRSPLARIGSAVR